MAGAFCVHITGASGAGVSTIGKALADDLGVAWLDTDDFFWQPTEPPYQRKRDIPERLRLLNTAFPDAPRGWILSGSLDC